MKKVIFLILITFLQVSWAEDDEIENDAQTEQVLSPSASSIPAMSPEQAKMLMEKVQQGHKLKEEQKKALEELDSEE